jgi:3-oxoacyl-[acyl-carrier-protein] synthase-3
VTGIEAEPGSRIGPFVFGTDGRGAENLIVPAGGMRTARTAESGVAQRDAGGNIRSQDNLFMNGGEIFTFTLSAVPKAVNQLLAKAEKTKDDVGLFVFHQANQYMLEALRKNLKLPPERFFMHLKDCGNTVSATIPIALKAAQAEGKLQDGDLVMVVGFGVGYSWAAALIRWTHK